MARQLMMTAEQKKVLLRNGATNLAHRMKDGNTQDFAPVVKLFNPCGSGTWLLSELDEDEDTAFGLCDIGHGCAELGNVSLSEMASVRLPYGLYIERDTSFDPQYSLGVYAEAGREKRRITESGADLSKAAAAISKRKSEEGGGLFRAHIDGCTFLKSGKYQTACTCGVYAADETRQYVVVPAALPEPQGSVFLRDDEDNEAERIFNAS